MKKMVGKHQKDPTLQNDWMFAINFSCNRIHLPDRYIGRLIRKAVPVTAMRTSRRKMEYKIYVGNLPYTTGDADLQAMFAEAGTVKSATVIKERDSGRSKGFGFVEMDTQEAMDKAISMFNGKDMGGRALSVNVARPKEDRPGGPRGGGGGGRRGGGGGGGGGYNRDRGRGDRDRDRNNSFG
jgi:RNA recognition motif-containing protein